MVPEDLFASFRPSPSAWSPAVWSKLLSSSQRRILARMTIPCYKRRNAWIAPPNSRPPSCATTSPVVVVASRPLPALPAALSSTICWRMVIAFLFRRLFTCHPLHVVFPSIAGPSRWPW